MLGWLFRKPLSRERAIALAAEFLVANGYRVVPMTADADLAGDDFPVVFDTASLPGRRWYIEFTRILPPGLWCSRTRVSVYVWVDTGLVTFDHFEGWA